MKKKLLVVIMAMCLLAAFMIGGTLAWLTSSPAAIENVFTFGKVEITLTETTGSSYKIVPGATLAKDPTITVKKGSEATWLFVKITEVDANSLIDWEIADGWTQLNDGENDVAGVYYRAHDAVADDAVSEPTVGILDENQVVCSSSAEAGDLAGTVTLTVTAYAVQKTAGTTAYQAWTAAAFV